MIDFVFTASSCLEPIAGVVSSSSVLTDSEMAWKNAFSSSSDKVLSYLYPNPWDSENGVETCL